MELINSNVKILKSNIHGWGVFANEFIKKDTIILQNPGVTLSSSGYYPRDLLLYFYPCDKDFILGLGPVSLINSSDEPNVMFEVDEKNKIITIKAVRDIQLNEEITFKYL
jgi:SET domain-containing protein